LIGGVVVHFDAADEGLWRVEGSAGVTHSVAAVAVIVVVTVGVPHGRNRIAHQAAVWVIVTVVRIQEARWSDGIWSSKRFIQFKQPSKA